MIPLLIVEGSGLWSGVCFLSAGVAGAAWAGGGAAADIGCMNFVISDTLAVLDGGVDASSSGGRAEAFFKSAGVVSDLRPRFFVSVENSQQLTAARSSSWYLRSTSAETIQQVRPYVGPASVHLLHVPISPILATICSFEGTAKSKKQTIFNNRPTNWTWN